MKIDILRKCGARGELLTKESWWMDESVLVMK